MKLSKRNQSWVYIFIFAATSMPSLSLANTTTLEMQQRFQARYGISWHDATEEQIADFMKREINPEQRKANRAEKMYLKKIDREQKNLRRSMKQNERAINQAKKKEERAQKKVSRSKKSSRKRLFHSMKKMKRGPLIKVD